MLLRLFFGTILMAGGAAALARLNQSGMDLLSFEQWATLLDSLAGAPAFYFRSIVLVSAALFLPPVGLVVFFSAFGASARRPPIDVHVAQPRPIRRIRADASMTALEEEPSRSLSPPAPAEDRAEQPKEKGVDARERLARAASVILRFGGRLAVWIIAAAKALVRSAIALVRGIPSDRILEAIQERIGRKPLSETGLSRHSEPPELRRAPAVPAVHDRIIEWYAAWVGLGEETRPPRLVEEAVALAKSFSPDVQNALFETYGLRGVSAQNALFAAVRHYEGGPVAEGSDDLAATPMDQPSFDELREGGSEEGEAVPDLAAAGSKADPRGNEEPDFEMDIEGNLLPSATPPAPAATSGPSSEIRPQAKAAVSEIELDASMFETEEEDEKNVFGSESEEPETGGTSTEEGEEDAGGEEEAPPGILDIEDDIGGIDEDLRSDARALQVLKSIVRKEGFSEEVPPEEESEDDRASLTRSNEEIEESIRSMDRARLLTIVGEKPKPQPAGDEAVPVLRNGHVLVPGLWSLLAAAVAYQSKAFAWSQFGETPPPELATPELREAFLVKLASAIVALRDQVPAATLEELCEARKDSEHVAWLRSRADTVVRALSTPEGRQRLCALLDVAPTAPAAEPSQREATGEAERAPKPEQAPEVSVGDAGQTKEGAEGEKAASAPEAREGEEEEELVFVDYPYDEAWTILAPIAQAYKQVSAAPDVDFYRAVAITTPGADEPQFGMMDIVVGDLRRRIKERLGPFEAGVIGIVFVIVRPGAWRLLHTQETDPFRDHFVLEGVGENEGRGIRVRDRNLRIWDAWVRGKGLRGHSLIHFVLEPGATFDGFENAEEAVAEFQRHAGREEAVEFRLAPWTAKEWHEAREAYIVPKP